MNPAPTLQEAAHGQKQKGGRPMQLEVSVLERFDPEGEPTASDNSATTTTTKRIGFRVAWKIRNNSLTMPGWMLRSERVQEFVQVVDPDAAASSGGGEHPRTAYRCWETFYGVLAPVVRLTVGSQVVNGFNVWMEDLKNRARQLEKTSS